MRRITIVASLAACTLLAGLVLSSCDLAAPDHALDDDLSASSRAGGTGFTFTTFEVPDALHTRAHGINAKGDIVGLYVDQTGVTRGFLLRDGEFTTLDFPGAAGTVARGIGPDGTVVGTYWPPDPPAFADYSFRWTPEGGFEAISVGDYSYSVATRILPDGTIIGCVHQMEGTVFVMKGFVMGRHGTQFDETPLSMHNGATPDRRKIAGFYFDPVAEQRRGYVMEDGVLRQLHVPGANLTEAWDISPAGEVAGLYRLPGPVFRGFVLRGNDYVTIHVPGAAHTLTYGINARGVIVGSIVVEGGRNLGLIATPSRRP
jgi:hypothetical protein